MPEQVTPTNVTITKLDAERHIAFGWASVAVRKTGETVVDWHGDIIELDELEDAVYDFVLEFREADEMHTEPVVARLVESVVVTAEKLKAWGLAEDAMPLGWWTGFKVDDAQVWRDVKKGRYTMFSIGGTAVREPVA